ncbi:MAG: acyl carrier protein [Eubacterium sp.]|nr:acyl carrier protein [Eubacterium sp.]
MEQFLGFVAGVFGCKADEVSMELKYQEYEKWDSIMMVRLVMEAEKAYGKNIPIESVRDIETIADLYKYIK